MHEFEAELWQHDSQGGWHFVTVPAAVSDDIESRTADRRQGFGSVRVQVSIGATTWTTSVFPDSKCGAYLLPVRKDVRGAEELSAGDQVRVSLELA